MTDEQQWRVALRTWRPLSKPRPLTRLARAIVVRSLFRWAFRIDAGLARDAVRWVRDV